MVNRSAAPGNYGIHARRRHTGGRTRLPGDGLVVICS
jgi:hypothetical protein